MTTKPKPILIVDDYEPNLVLLRYVFESHKYRVETARDAHEAIRLMHAEVPCALVTDLYMPHMSGYDLVRYMRSFFSLMTVPVVIMTAKMPPDTAYVIAEESAVHHVILHPANPETVLRTMEDALHNRPHLLPRTKRHYVLMDIIKDLRTYAKGALAHVQPS